LFYQKFCSAEEQFLKYQPNTLETSMKYKLTTQAVWFHYCTMKTPLNYEDIYIFCNVLFVLNMIRFSSVVVVTGLLAGELRNRGLNPDRYKKSFPSLKNSKSFGPHPASCYRY
jgi:hypothetical protein